MSDNKTILKLHYRGYSQRQIAEYVKASRKNTVSPVIKAAAAMNLSLEKIVDLSEDELNALLFPEKQFIPEYVQPDYEYCHKELMKDGMNG